MFTKVLVANRGEIAVRIIKACQEMGIKTVAIYSEVDKNAPHVQLADESVNLGDPTPIESYLNIPKIIKFAQDVEAEAIHPGYGFLAENPDFAKTCDDIGIKFIGPSPKVISLMGDKIAAKKTMEKADVPVIPGYHGTKQDNSYLVKEGKKIGFPLLVKAAAGGGGKGMRIVHSEDTLEESIESAKRESKSSFGNDTVFLEKYIDKPRHIEFQILADENGNTVHLFERECSIQRRHQKIIEETPSPVMTKKLREQMGEAAVAAAEAVGYSNAGTVEFMVDGDLNFYFMEMNTRLQVEHPITEMTTGVDLAKWQLRIASGMSLTLKQKDLMQRGHAIECRIYAEDPSNGFLPSIGTLEKVEPPTGPNVRDDSGIYTGMEVTPYYDPMLAKLVVSSENRDESINKMLWALSRYIVLGVTTNISFLKKVLEHEEFKKGNITTHFIDNYFKDWTTAKEGLPVDAIIALAVYDSMHSKSHEIVRYKEADPHSPWKNVGRWRVGGRGGCDVLFINYEHEKHVYNVTIERRENSYFVMYNNIEYKVKAEEIKPGYLKIKIGDRFIKSVITEGEKEKYVFVDGNVFKVRSVELTGVKKTKKKEEGDLSSPISGKVVSVKSKEGAAVKKGDVLMVIEAMKMEYLIRAPYDGKVKKVNFKEKDQIEIGQNTVELIKNKEA